jgi:Rps23 Pro-64 3,4-dihydroxylase Tpa1-like proline 4-hydroxylase
MVAVYYLDCVDNDKDGGKLIFHDPAFNQVIKTRPKSKMSIETEKNTIIIVPAHVWHEVTPYYGEEDRLAVVMNISFPAR